MKTTARRHFMSIDNRGSAPSDAESVGRTGSSEKGRGPRSCRVLWAVAGLMVLAGGAEAGGIAGLVTANGTGAPLEGIDIDLFDQDFNSIATSAVTDADGTFLISPLNAGNYYVRVDPNADQGYVDEYYPGVFLKSLAAPVVVPVSGTVPLTFQLDLGAKISGVMVDGNSVPAVNVDLDIYTAGGEFIPSVNTATDASGAYVLGALPPGGYAIGADPDLVSFLIPEFYDNHLDQASADPVNVSGTATFGGIDFGLAFGGTVSGVVTDLSGTPLVGIDIDVFDSAGVFYSAVDAMTDATGAYEIGVLPPGTYYVQADASILDGYVDTYFGGTTEFALATPVVVGTGATTAGVDIQMPLGGTISGVVTNASTGQPIAGIRVSVFDDLGSILPWAGASTDASGAYTVGALPAGSFYVRSAGDPSQGLAYEYWPNVTFRADASLVAVTAGTDSPGRNFALDQGGYIEGYVYAPSQPTPLPGADLDLYGTNGEFVGAVDAGTDANGYYRLGPIPVETFLVQAEPPVGSSYVSQYYDHVASQGDATEIPVSAGSTVSGIDFDLGTAANVPEGGALASLHLALAPNPTRNLAHVSYVLPEASHVTLTLHDVTGRRIATWVDEDQSAGVHSLDVTVSDIAADVSGVAFVRFQTAEGTVSGRLTILR